MTAPDEHRMAALEASHRELISTLAPLARRVRIAGEAGFFENWYVIVRRAERALANARALHQPSQGEGEG